MAIGTQAEDDQMLSEINMIPFIDVMLVLLIIFIITVPVIKHSVNLELPEANSQPLPIEIKSIQLAIDAQGQYFWDDVAVTEDDLNNRLQGAAKATPQPTLHIRGDKAVRYEFVAQAMARAQQAGLRQIGFVTEAAPANQP